MPLVLIVEDNEMNRDMLSRRLQCKELDVVCAIDGPMGIAMDVAGRTRLDPWALSGDVSFHF